MIAELAACGYGGRAMQTKTATRFGRIAVCVRSEMRAEFIRDPTQPAGSS